MAQVQWLRDVIKSAGAHGLDRVVNRRLPTNHHDDRIGSGLQNLRHQIETADFIHIDVADYQVEILPAENCQRSLS